MKTLNINTNGVTFTCNITNEVDDELLGTNFIQGIFPHKNLKKEIKNLKECGVIFDEVDVMLEPCNEVA
jgi:hypothetical protein